MAAHYLKNLKTAQIALENQPTPAEEKVYFVTLKGDKDRDYKVEKKIDGSFEVTDVESGKTTTINATDFDL